MRLLLLFALLSATAAAACSSAETCSASGRPPTPKCKKIEVCCSDTLCRYIVSLEDENAEYRCDRNPTDNPFTENGMETTFGRDCTRTATTVINFCNTAG